MNRVIAAILGSGLVALHYGREASRLVVHEWGTITTVHAPDGTPHGRLNRIAPADTLPAFVHRFEPAATQSAPQNSLLKTTLTPGRPDVTMRLETPVIYFYRPRAQSRPTPFDVSVRFRGGVLNEFYPRADGSVAVDVERVSDKMRAGLLTSWDGAVLDNYVLGALRWQGLALRDSVALPATTAPVWLAPRRVRSAGVATPSGEGERYLFYRGVAHLDALFRTRLTERGLTLHAPERLLWMARPSMRVPRVWLLDVRPDGRAAIRERSDIAIIKSRPGAPLGVLPLFAGAEYSTSGLAGVRRSMKRALIAAGLFADEAEAMLETWKASYFSNPGLRVLYVVPREWIDYFLPLDVSVPHTLTRVLIGRIDLERPPRGQAIRSSADGP